MRHILEEIKKVLISKGYKVTYIDDEGVEYADRGKAGWRVTVRKIWRVTDSKQK